MGRVVGVVVLMVVIGLAGGAAAAWFSEPGTSTGTTGPVPGSSPSVPGPAATTEPTTPAPGPPAEDIDYPVLTTPRDYDSLELVNGLQSWTYVRPADWQAYGILSGGGEEAVEDDGLADFDEIRFRPADEPVEGGYSLRVKAVDQHLTTSAMVEAKVRALSDPEAFVDFTVLEQTDDALYFTYRTESDRLRYNFFRWYAAPDSSEATLEMSVVGRATDEAGLRGLLVQFSDRLAPLD